MTHDRRTFLYVDSDVPPGESLVAWRRSHQAAPRRHHPRRLARAWRRATAQA